MMWWIILVVYAIGFGMAFVGFSMFAWIGHSLTFGRSSRGDILLTVVLVLGASILWLPIILFILVSYLWDYLWG